MLQSIVQSIFTGYACYSLIYIFGLKRVHFSRQEFVEALDKTASMAFAAAGIIYTALWIAELYKTLGSGHEYYAFRNRALGEFMIFYWLQIIIYVIGSQLMWFNKFRQINWLRIIVSILMIVPMERVNIIMTSMHKDYIPSSWTISLGNTIISLVFSTCIFVLFIVFITFTNKSISKKS
ncbi:MAG: hypothetical protein HYZ42_11525 [Bacteroidetes bacterium]|nr:hypothetical protein [Bacteroidota bacterium]